MSIETTDAANGVGTTYVITTSDAFSGELSTDYDEDWVRAVLEANYGYVFRLAGDASATSISDAYLALNQANGDRITSYNSSTRTAIVSITTTADGTYYAQVGDDGTSGRGEAGTYELELIREIATGVGTRKTLSVGNTQSSELEHDYDEDWFELNLEANYGYVIRLTGDASVSSISDAYLALNQANGDRITSYNSSTRTAIVSITTTADGTYYAQVGDDGTSGRGEAGSYELELIREIATGVGTRKTLSVGNTQSSELEHDYDEDWFELNLEANYGYVIRLTGDASVSSISDAYLALNQANGDRITSYNSSTRTAIVSITTTADGTYYAQVGDDGTSGRGEAGTYELELIREIASGVGTRESLTLGKTASSTLEHDTDSDWFAVDLEIGKTYAFNVTSDGSATGITDSAIALHYINGDYLDGETSSTASASFTYTATATGTHYVRVGSQGSSYGEAGTYEVTATEDIPNTYDGSKKAKLGKLYTSSVDFEDDLDGFAVKLKKGKLYDIFVAGDGHVNGVDHVSVEWWDEGYYPEAEYGSSSATMVQSFKPTSKGTYYFFVGNSDGDLGGLGTYVFGVFTAKYGNNRNNLINGTKGNDSAHGGGGNDTLRGKNGLDLLFGDGGKDKLYGHDGNDKLFGGSKSDKLDGGSGNDLLDGGGGNDMLRGGSGADIFVMSEDGGKDKVLDFNAKLEGEKIDLTGIGSIVSYEDLLDKHMSKSGKHVVIKSGSGEQMILLNTKLNQLDADDFLF